MRNLFALLLILLFGATVCNNAVSAQDNSGNQQLAFQNAKKDDTTTKVEETKAEPAKDDKKAEDKKEADKPKTTFYQIVKKYYIDGGWEFMSLVLITLIFGLAVAIERVITLSLATVNTRKLLGRIEDRIKNRDIEGAREICLSTSGPTAEVLGEGLRRVDDGIEAVESAITSNGSVQVGLLEKGLVWLALFIALAPMLGFLGTVIGMIFAFDTIQASGDIKPDEVAGGIKIALITTVFGLIVAMILQIFYNLITSKVDALTNKMEDATISLIDILIDNGYKNGNPQSK
jgi:biopolymer transport protein ExbB